MKRVFFAFVFGLMGLFSLYALENDLENPSAVSVQSSSFSYIHGENYIPVDFTAYYQFMKDGSMIESNTVRWIVTPSEGAFFNNGNNTGNPVGIKFTKPGTYQLTCNDGKNQSGFISIEVY